MKKLSVILFLLKMIIMKLNLFSIFILCSLNPMLLASGGGGAAAGTLNPDQMEEVRPSVESKRFFAEEISIQEIRNEILRQAEAERGFSQEQSQQLRRLDELKTLYAQRKQLNDSIQFIRDAEPKLEEEIERLRIQYFFQVSKGTFNALLGFCRLAKRAFYAHTLVDLFEEGILENWSEEERWDPYLSLEVQGGEKSLLNPDLRQYKKYHTATLHELYSLSRHCLDMKSSIERVRDARVKDLASFCEAYDFPFEVNIPVREAVYDGHCTNPECGRVVPNIHSSYVSDIFSCYGCGTILTSLTKVPKVSSPGELEYSYVLPEGLSQASDLEEKRIHQSFITIQKCYNIFDSLVARIDFLEEKILRESL